MGSIKEERGVLKLVHPGRYVEIHRKPIRAAEVMRRNRRHCITRPDVFDFPWIVVKPESLLLPGSVFLIVPNRKIYELLKAKEQCNHSAPFSQQNQSPNNHVHQQLKHASQVTSYAWMRSKNQRLEKCNKGLFVGREKERVGREVEEKLHILNKPFLPLSQRSPNCLSKTMSPDRENVCKYDWDKRYQNQEERRLSRESVSHVSLTAIHMGIPSLNTEKGSQKHCHVEIWPKLNSYEDTKKEIEQELLEESSFESIPYEAKQYYQKYKKSMETESPKKDVNMMFVSNEQIKMLKSCLRRPDSIRKSLNLKVSFNIPIKKDEQ